MPVKQKKIATTEQAFSFIGERIKQKALNPDISMYKPHDRQIDFHKSTANQRLYIGGNRAGKTVGGACEAVWWLTGRHPYQKTPKVVHGRIVASDFIQGIGKIVLPMVSRWLPPSALINGSWEDSYIKESRTLVLANGNDVEFLSYDQDLVKFAGTSRNFVWFDEEPPEDVFGECLMRTLDVGGKTWATLTPVDGMTWIYDKLYLKGLDPTDEQIHVTQVNTTDNPYLPENATEAIAGFYDDSELAARLHGRFVQRAGLIYPNFTKENGNIVPFIPNDKLPKDLLHIASLDAGISNPTAWLWSFVDKSGNVTVYDEYYKAGDAVEPLATAVHRYNLEHGVIPSYYVGDPAIKAKSQLNGSSVLEEYAANGIYIALANNDTSAGYSRVKSYISGKQGRKLFVTENCTTLIAEMSKLHWATYQTKRISKDNNAKEIQHKKDDHSCDSLRYMIMSRPDLMDTGEAMPEFDKELLASMSMVPHRTTLPDDGIRRASFKTKPPTDIYDEHVGEM